MYKLVLIRHGESQWNKENRFTGWKDVDLSEKGIAEAHAAGKLLKEQGYTFDEAYTSVLKRAIRTLWIILDEMDLIWRRSFDIPPGALDENDERYLGKDPRYSSIEKGKFPKTECLKDTVARAVPYLQSEILPKVKAGKRLIVAAHGNSLRAVIKYL